MEFIENSSSKSSSKNATNSVQCTKGKLDRLRGAQEAAKKRCALEQYRCDMEQYASGLSRESLRADWEAEGERRTLHSRVRREVGQATGAMEVELRDRRMRLHDLLRGEEDQYLQEELELGHKEDPETKWDKMLSRYLELRMRKEEERQRVAHEKREQQFRLNCDDLRSQLSRRLQIEIAADSKMAASEKKTSRVDDEAFDELWKRDEETKRRMEENEKAETRRKAVETKNEVTEQIEEKKARRWKEVLEKETDAEMRDENKRLLALEEECEKEARRRKKEIVRSDLDECMKSKMRLKSQEAQDDILEDMFFLTQAMGDAEHKTSSEEKKKRLLHEQRNFLEYTREEGRRRNAEEAEADRICQEAMEREAKKQQEERQEERERTREKTLEAATVIRQQMEDNLESLRRTYSANKKQFNKVLKKDEEDKKTDEEKRRFAREANLMYQSELLNQMEMKKNKLEREKNLNNTEIEKLLEAQEDEDIKIRHLVAEMKIDHEHPYRIARRQYFNDCGDREA